MKKILFYILFFVSLTTNAQDIAKKLAEIKKNPLKIKTLDLSESKLKELTWGLDVQTKKKDL